METSIPLASLLSQGAAYLLCPGPSLLQGIISREGWAELGWTEPGFLLGAVAQEDPGTGQGTGVSCA